MSLYLRKIPPYYLLFLMPLVVEVAYLVDLFWNGVFFRLLGEREQFLAYYHIAAPAVWLLLAACPGKQRLNAEFSIAFYHWKTALAGIVGKWRQLILPVALLAVLIVLEASVFANAQGGRGRVFHAVTLPLDFFDPMFVTLLTHVISRVASLDLAGLVINVPGLVILWLSAFWVVRGARPMLVAALLILFLANDYVLLFHRVVAPVVPAAIVGTLGLVLIARRAPHVGLAFLAFSCLLRVPGIFFMIAGLVLMAVMIVRGDYRFRDINYVYLALLGVASLYEYVNVYIHYENVFGGFGHFVVSELDPSAGTFGPLELVVNLGRIAPVFTVAVLTGGLYGAVRRDKQTLMLWRLLLLVMAVRLLSFSEVFPYYSLIFAPFALLIGLAGFNRLAADIGKYYPTTAVAPAALLLAVSVIPSMEALHSWWTDPFNKWRGDAQRLVRDLSTLQPEDAEILERGGNLVLYVNSLHGRVLSRTMVPYYREAVLRLVDERVASSRCVVLIMVREYVREHLKITRDELAARGFVDAAAVFRVPAYRMPKKLILALPGCALDTDALKPGPRQDLPAPDA